MRILTWLNSYCHQSSDEQRPGAAGGRPRRADWRRWLLAAAFAGTSQPGLAQQTTRPQPAGTWVGTVQLFGTPTPMLLDFAPLTQPGAKRATMALPQLGLHAVQLDTLAPWGDSLRLPASALPGTLVLRATTGTLGLVGYLLTSGQRAALHLRPATPLRLARVVPSRAQQPAAPYPYQQLPVRFAGGAPGVRLAGTLTAPASRRGPTVVLVSGSGPHNRDSEQFAHQPFRVLADALTRRGFLVLRYDERGVGASTGRYAAAGTADFARDAAAAVRALRTDPRVHVGKVYLLGHSQGTLEVVRVAAHDPTLAGVVLLGGIGRPLRLGYQERIRANFRDRLAAASPAERPGVEKYVHLHERLIAIAAAQPDSAAALAQMRREAPALGVSVEELDNYAPTYLEHTLHDILTQDPAPNLRRLTMPVLAVTGAGDTETPAAGEFPALRAHLQQAGNQHVTTNVVPRVNHFFQTTLAGQEQSVFDNPETFSPAELRLVLRWLAAQAGLPKAQP